MNTLFIALNQIRLFSKSSGTLALFIIGPVFIIYLIAQAFTGIFASGGQGLRALDYFGVTILTITVFQGTSVASWAIFKDKRSNTEVRISLAPVKKWEFLCGTFLGVWVSLAVLSCAIFVLLILLLSVDYGPRPGFALLFLTAEAFLAAAIGVSLAVLLDNEKAANGIVSTIVPLFVFIGGGYMMIPETGFLADISVLSPIRWLNLALLSEASGSPNKEYALTALLFCFALSAVLLAGAGIKVWRKKI